MRKSKLMFGRTRISALSGLKSLCLILCLSLLAGCASVPCVRSTLMPEQHPAMLMVETDDEGGLDSDNTQTMLINLELYRGALDKCNQTINVYNGTVK
jgi:hypothetical protein